MNRSNFLLISLLIFASSAFSAPVIFKEGALSSAAIGIGNTATPDASSILDVKSTTLGALIPRMTTTQRNSISSPATGLLVWDTTVGTLYQYNSGWKKVSADGQAPNFTGLTVGSLSGALYTASGVLTVESQLSPSRGGTGQDFSSATGLVKVSSGTMSAATLVNADVSSSAAIARSKIATGTANHVVINDGSGNLSSEANLAISRGGTGAGAKTAAFDALSPNTTKGDIAVHNGTNNVRVGIGSDGQILTADSSQTSGLKWAPGGSGGGNGVNNVLQNSSFEDTTVTDNWTVTTGTASAEATNVVNGVQSMKIVLSSVTGTIVSQSVTPAVQYSGLNIDAGMWVKTSLTTVQVCALEAGAEIQCVNAPSDSTWHYVFTTVAGPSSGSIGVRLKTSSSSSGTVYADAAYAGITQNVPVPQSASLWAKGSWAPASSCTWSITTSTWQNFSANTNCNNPTTVGYASAPGTKIPGITISNLPAGDYQVILTGSIYATGTGNPSGQMRVSDGTNTSSAGGFNNNTSGNDMVPSIVFSLHTSADQSNVTVQVQAETDGNGTPSINIALGSTSLQVPNAFEIAIYKMPNAATSQVGYQLSNALSLTGQVFYVASSTCPTGSMAADGSAVSRSTYALLFNLIGTTFGVGDGSTTFNVPNVSGIFMRGAGSQTISSIAHSTTLGTVQNDQFQGHFHDFWQGPAGSGTTTAPLVASASPSNVNTSQQVRGPVTDGTNGTPRTGTETRPANIGMTACIAYASNPMPAITQSVITSNATGTTMANVGTVTCGSSASINAAPGGWISAIGNISGNRCSLTFATGVFSAAPICFADIYSTATNTVAHVNVNVASATSASIGCLAQVSGTTTACTGPDQMNIECWNPR